MLEARAGLPLCFMLHALVPPCLSTSVSAMDYRKRDNGLLTFLEHWNILIVAVVAFIAFKVLDFFMRLSGAPRLWFLFAAFALMISGGGMITYAKLPVYRSGRFFTFGFRSVPAHLQGVYRWGWRVFLFGVVLSLCLLLSKP